MEEIQMFWDRSKFIFPTARELHSTARFLSPLPTAILSNKKISITSSSSLSHDPHQLSSAGRQPFSRVIFFICWQLVASARGIIVAVSSLFPLPGQLEPLKHNDHHQESLISGSVRCLKGRSWRIKGGWSVEIEDRTC